MKVRLGQFSFNISLLPLQQPAITMAERQPEEEERQFLCELCPKSYKSVKSLLRHLREKHAGNPLLEEAIKSVPKEKCPFCGQSFSRADRRGERGKENFFCTPETERREGGRSG